MAMQSFFSKLFNSEKTIPIINDTKITKFISKTEGINISTNRLTEEFKSELDDSKKRLSGLLSKDKEIIEHPFDFNQVIELYKTFGPIHGVVAKYKDFILGPGFYVKAKDPRVADILNNWIDDMQFHSWLDSIITTTLITGTTGVELASNKQGIIEKIKIIDPNTFYVKQNNKGEITGAVQILKSQRQPIIFENNEIAIFSLNKVGLEPYGYGIVYSSLSIVNDILQSRKDLHTIQKRKANSPLWAKLGGVFGDKLIEPSDADVQNASANLEYMNNKTEFATGPYMDFKVLDFGVIGDKFAFILNDDWKMFFTTVQVPQVLLGEGNVAEGLAQVQLEAFDRRIKSMQEEIENVIEIQIFSKILIAQGFQDADFDFVWGLPSATEKNQRLDRIVLMLQNPMLNSQLRTELELEVGRIMDLKFGKSPEEEKSQELNKEPQPSLPTINQRVNQSCDCIDDDKKKNITERNYQKLDPSEIDVADLNKDYTIEEFVGFNYLDYVAEIITAIGEDEFTNLLATNQIEKVAGKLSNNQIDALKEVLRDGVSNGWTMKEIANEIKKGVKPGDLYRLNDDGTLATDADGNKILKLSSEYRPILIARTEIVRLSNNGAVAVYENNNIKEVRAVAALSERTCDECSSYNGTILSVEESYDIFPLHPNCRCFADFNVPIYTSKGWKQIIDIKEGDLVLSDKGKFRKVTHLIRTPKYKGALVRLTFQDIKNKMKRKVNLRTTPEHPYLTINGWKNAIDININDEVITMGQKCKHNEEYLFANTTVINKEIVILQKAKTLYNFSVEEDESYIAKGFVTHNCRFVAVVEGLS